MNILCSEKLEKSDVYRYTINQGGALDIRVSNGSDMVVKITFVNGKFRRVDSNMHNAAKIADRSTWHVYGAITAKITELEARYAEAEKL